MLGFLCVWAGCAQARCAWAGCSFSVGAGCALAGREGGGFAWAVFVWAGCALAGRASAVLFLCWSVLGLRVLGLDVLGLCVWASVFLPPKIYLIGLLPGSSF